MDDSKSQKNSPGVVSDKRMEPTPPPSPLLPPEFNPNTPSLLPPELNPNPPSLLPPELNPNPPSLLPPKLNSNLPFKKAPAADNPEAKRQLRTIRRKIKRNRAISRPSRRLQIKSGLSKLSSRSLIAAVICAPFALEGAHLVGALIVATLAATSLASSLISKRLSQERFRVSLFAFALTIAAFGALLQAVPLPTMFHSLNGEAGVWLEGAFRSINAPVPSWMTLSLNPAESTRMGLGFFAAASVFIVSYNDFRERERFFSALMVPPLIGVALILLGAAQAAAQTSQRWFLYTSESATDALFCASFLEPIHLGVLLALLSLIPLGLSRSSFITDKSLRHKLFFLICSLGVMFTFEPFAIAAWIFGVLTFALLGLFDQLYRRVDPRWISLPLTIAAVVLGVAANELSSHLPLSSDTTPLQNLSIFDTIAVFSALPLFGSGQGAAADALAASGFGHAGFTSGALQFGLGFGGPLSLILLSMISLPVLRAATQHKCREGDVPVRHGLLAALAVYVFSSVFTTASTSVGIIVPCAFIAGILLGRDCRAFITSTRKFYLGRLLGEWQSREPDTTEAEKRSTRNVLTIPGLKIILGTILAALTLLAGSLTAMAVYRPPPLLAHSASIITFDETANDTLTLRPFDPLTHLEIAHGQMRLKRNTVAIDAAVMASALQPDSPDSRLLEARLYLLQKQPDSAIKSLKMAAQNIASKDTNTRTNAERFAHLITSTTQDHTLIANILPNHSSLWDETLKAVEDNTQQLKLIEHLLERAPPVELEKVAIFHKATAFRDLNKLEEATELAQGLVDDHNATSAAFILLTELLRQQGEFKKALKIAEKGITLVNTTTELMFLAFEISLELNALQPNKPLSQGHKSKITFLMTQLRPLILQEQEARFRFYMLSGTFFQQTANRRMAIRDFYRASENNPSSPAPRIHLTPLLIEDRNLLDALKNTNKLLENFPEHHEATSWRHTADELNRKIDEQQIHHKWTPP